MDRQADGWINGQDTQCGLLGRPQNNDYIYSTCKAQFDYLLTCYLHREEEEDFAQTARSVAWELIPFSAL